jgi:hypothetical protein
VLCELYFDGIFKVGSLQKAVGSLQGNDLLNKTQQEHEHHLLLQKTEIASCRLPIADLRHTT